MSDSAPVKKAAFAAIVERSGLGTAAELLPLLRRRPRAHPALSRRFRQRRRVRMAEMGTAGGSLPWSHA